MASPGLQMIRDTIYSLKQDYSLKILLINDVSAFDLGTGKKLAAPTTLLVKKAILLPATMISQFMKLFNQSHAGVVNTDERIILIDKRDIPSTFVLDTDCFIGYNGDGTKWIDLSVVTWDKVGAYNVANNTDVRKLSIKKVEDSLYAYALTVKGVNGI